MTEEKLREAARLKKDIDDLKKTISCLKDLAEHTFTSIGYHAVKEVRIRYQEDYLVKNMTLEPGDAYAMLLVLIREKEEALKEAETDFSNL